MKHTLTLTLLFITNTVFGQAFTFNDLPWLSSPVNTANSTNFSGAEYVWISSDLTTNSSISGNWVDRIQSFNYLQGNSSSRPTNSANGIWLDATHWLTNAMTGNNMGSNVTFGFIIKIVDPLGGGGVFPGLGGNRFAGTDGGGRWDFRFKSSGGSGELAVTQPPSPISIQVPSGRVWFITNVVFDLVISQIMTNNGSGAYTVYTNGVLMGKTLFTFTDGQWFGSTNIVSSQHADGAMSYLLLNNSRASSAKAFLLEHWIWTNDPPGAANGHDISADALSSFHTRATNYYGVSP